MVRRRAGVSVRVREEVGGIKGGCSRNRGLRFEGG
jgi:hypothetical protein